MFRYRAPRECEFDPVKFAFPGVAITEHWSVVICPPSLFGLVTEQLPFPSVLQVFRLPAPVPGPLASTTEQ